MGYSMRKAVHIVVFSALGLFATWSALWLVARVDWSQYTRAIPNSCREIDHCDVAWYFVAWFFLSLLLPTLVHAAAGWRLTNAARLKAVVAVPLLWLGTLAFYASVRLIGGY
jgi:hypothetical protein